MPYDPNAHVKAKKGKGRASRKSRSIDQPKAAPRLRCPSCGENTNHDESSHWCDKCEMLWPTSWLKSYWESR